MVGWHHRLNGHEFESTPGVGDGQGGLACCGPWGREESDTTEQMNWTELQHRQDHPISRKYNHVATHLEHSERDGNTRPPDLPPEKPVHRPGSDRNGQGTTDWF